MIYYENEFGEFKIVTSEDLLEVWNAMSTEEQAEYSDFNEYERCCNINEGGTLEECFDQENVEKLLWMHSNALAGWFPELTESLDTAIEEDNPMKVKLDTEAIWMLIRYYSEGERYYENQKNF